MRIKKADINDADIVGYVHSTAWKQAYKDIFPMDYLEADTPEVRACEFREACRDERILYFLLYEDKTAIGIVKVESERNERCEILSIYILEKYRNKGYGKQFIAYLKDTFEYKKIYLWVLEENMKARFFYESEGFCLTGKKREINRGKQFKQLEYMSVK